MMDESSVQTQIVTRGRRNPLHFGLPRRLRVARDAANLGTAQLSLAANLSHTVAADIERGGVPQLDTLEKIASVLKVSPCWLAYNVDAPIVLIDDLLCSAVGKRLQQIREVRGLSQRALGKLAGVSHTALQNIEAWGHMPTVATVEALAKALKIDPCWLGYGAGQAPDLPPPGPLSAH